MSGVSLLVLLLVLVIVPIGIGIVTRLWAQRRQQRGNSKLLARRWARSSAAPPSRADSHLKSSHSTNAHLDTDSKALKPDVADGRSQTNSPRSEAQQKAIEESEGAPSALVQVRVTHYKHSHYEQQIYKAAIAHEGSVSAPYHYVYRDEVSATFTFSNPISASRFKSRIKEICPSVRF